MQNASVCNGSRVYGGIHYPDLTQRDNTAAPKSDLYVAGFPCQPFSQMGSQKGMNEDRGLIFNFVADYIRVAQPKLFLLENVACLSRATLLSY